MSTELKPIEIQLGNFIESMGNIEMVTGISKQPDDSFFIQHNGWNSGTSPIPDTIMHSTYPIPLTDEWKLCFGIDKYEIPKHIKYVHQCQNYFLWALQVNLLEIMNWDLLPKSVPLI